MTTTPHQMIAFMLLSVTAITSSNCGAQAEETRLRETPTAAAEAAPRAQVDSALVQLRRLWAGAGPNLGSSPSPDGRYVTNTDWTTGDLAVRDLTDGSLYRVTDKGNWSTSGDYALSSAFSSRGDAIAYVWWNNSVQRHELRAARFDVDASGKAQGSGVRVVYSNPGLQPRAVFGWAADNSILVAVGRPDRTAALALVSAEGGEIRILESFDWRTPHATRSPDGHTIAYDFPSDNETPERDIHLLSDDGARKATVVRGPADDVVLGWQPDGSGLLFASREAAGADILRIPIADGAPSGPAALVRAELPGRIVPLGMVGGTLYFGVPVESTELHISRLGNDGSFSNTESLRDPYGGSIRAWDWSPDGEHLVHDARILPAAGDGDFRIVLRSLEGEPLRNFHLEGRAESIRWGPDGRMIYLYAWDRVNLPGLRSLDLESGSVRTIKRFEFQWQAMGGDFALSPDGKQLYYRLLDPGAAVARPTRGSIVRMDLATGVERPIQIVRFQGSLAVSPDGRQLAYVDYEPDGDAFVLRVIPVEGGEARELFRQIPGASINGVNWTPDGQSFVFLGGSPANPGGNQLLEISAAGGEPTLLADVSYLADGDPRLTVDGRWIAYRAGRSRGEIWALEGLMPAVAPRAENEGSSR